MVVKRWVEVKIDIEGVMHTKDVEHQRNKRLEKERGRAREGEWEGERGEGDGALLEEPQVGQ